MKLCLLRFISFVVIILLISSCEKDSKRQNELRVYKSFRDIPDITDDEIAAVETFRAKKVSFIYGVIPSTEAFYKQSGEIKGYAALFCKYLTELFGIDFKPTIYEWDDLIAGLASGNIDFAGDLTATDERRKIYYMTDAIMERTVKLFRLKDAEPISAIAASRLPRYGFLKGAVTANMVSSASRDKFEILFFPNHNVVYDALKSGQIDAYLDENNVEAVFESYKDVVPVDFLPLIYNTVSLTTQKPDLVPIISIVQKMLKNINNNYLIEIYNQGRREYIKSKLEKYFSDEEREYISQHPVVQFAAEFDNYPMSFYNKHENQWQGVTFDILSEVKEFSGISFEVANAPNTKWADLLEMLENGTVPMVSELIRSKDRENRFLWSKTALMQDNYCLISKQEKPYMITNDVLRMKVGLTKGTAHAELFKAWFPNHSKTIEFENMTDSFYALERGDIDLVMASQNIFLTMVNYMENPDYKINLTFDYAYESLLGFNKNEHILNSIVEKTLQQIDIKRISGQWKNKTYEYRTKSAETRVLWFIGFSVLFFCVIILLFVLYRRIKHEEKRLEHMVQKRTAEINEQRKLLEHMSLTDELTGLPNRRNFDGHLDVEWRIAIREKRDISFLMLDIDNFKMLNDKYGHQHGDNVLRAIAKTIGRTLKRPGDFASRWGGEEFAILLSYTSITGASIVAESIRSNVENINVPLPNGDATKVTVSIGVNTQMPIPGSPLEAFISAADSELYRAKRTGKNKVCSSV
jgi:diguanylate cyclase (GGDEF)-like protein